MNMITNNKPSTAGPREDGRHALEGKNNEFSWYRNNIDHMASTLHSRVDNLCILTGKSTKELRFISDVIMVDDSEVIQTCTYGMRCVS